MVDNDCIILTIKARRVGWLASNHCHSRCFIFFLLNWMYKIRWVVSTPWFLLVCQNFCFSLYVPFLLQSFASSDGIAFVSCILPRWLASAISLSLPLIKASRCVCLYYWNPMRLRNRLFSLWELCYSMFFKLTMMWCDSFWISWSYDQESFPGRTAITPHVPRWSPNLLPIFVPIR